MRHHRLFAIAATALAILAAPALAADTTPTPPAGAAQGGGPGGGPGSGPGWGPGMMGGYGPGPGAGMMGGYGPGMGGYGPGMMGGYGPGYGRHMMGGWGRGAGGGPCWNQAGDVDLKLTPDDVKQRITRHLAMQGNPHLKLGNVAAAGDNTISAEIVTQDGSLVDKFTVDTRTGFMRRSD